MTVIMGLNLCDRICLLADSRVSNFNRITGETTVRHDNMMKIEPLEGPKGCVVACAGDALFAQKLIKQINKDFKDSTVIELREHIYDWAIKQGESYSTINNRSLVTLLIAGIDESSKKTIDRQKLTLILDSYFKGEVGVGSMRKHLSDAIERVKDGDSNIILDANNTVLFSVKIDLQSGVSIKDTSWGDILISGPTRIEQDEISPADIGRFEFDQINLSNPQQMIDHDSVIMTAIASSMAAEKEWLSVGGSYIPMHLYCDGKLATLPRQFYSSKPDGSDVQFVSAYIFSGDRFYRLDKNGTRYRMETVSEFRTKKTERKPSSLHIEL